MASSWTDTNNAHRLPDSTDSVCISLSGTYTVTQDVYGNIAALTVGGGAAGVQTLLEPTGAQLNIAGDSSIAGNGVLTVGAGGVGNTFLYLPGTLTNAGTLKTVGGGSRYLRTSIANSGTVDIASGNTYSDGYPGATAVTNTGIFTVEAGGAYDLSGGSTFTDSAGSISNAGSLSVSGGTFTQRGASITGGPVVLNSSTLNDATTAGAGSFLLTGSSVLSGTGIAAGQTVTLDSDSHTAMSANFTNAGTLNVGTSSAGNTDFNGSGLLTNTGTLNAVSGGGGARYLRISIANAGTFDVASASTQSDNFLVDSTVTNTGRLTVEAGAAYAFSYGAKLVNAGGSIANSGSLSLTTGTFTQRGGTTSGTPVLLTTATLDDDTTAGAGLFLLDSSSIVTGSGPSPGIAAGQIVTVESGAQAAVNINLTNAGTLNVGTGNPGNTSLYGTGLLTNTGTITTVAGGGGSRYVRVSIANSGLVDVASPNTASDGYPNATTFSNTGTFKLEAGSYPLGNGSSFTQTSAGTFATYVNAATNTAGSITSGVVQVGGTLRVATTASPTLGASYAVVSGAARTGTFSALDFGSGHYDVAYPSDGVTLTVAAGPPPAAPVFTASSPPAAGTAGTAYGYQFAASGNPTPTFAVASGSLPAGLALDPGTGKLAGTPTAAGSSSFTVRASNGVNPAAVTGSITIVVASAPAAPVFTASSPPATGRSGRRTPISSRRRVTQLRRSRSRRAPSRLG